jgi:hypothetical protein
MEHSMNRRHWLGSLFAALAGAWVAGRARAAARPVVSPATPPRPPVPVGVDYPSGSYTYSSGAVPLCRSPVCNPHVTVTTYSYSAASAKWDGA